jgi:uncharacterized membrane protein YeaQ/YmgE (transglycosylase-associated protein family)
MNFVLFILIGLIAAALAGRVVSGHGYGVLGDMVVGVIGAFLGGGIFAHLGLPGARAARRPRPPVLRREPRRRPCLT